MTITRSPLCFTQLLELAEFRLKRCNPSAYAWRFSYGSTIGRLANTDGLAIAVGLEVYTASLHASATRTKAVYTATMLGTLAVTGQPRV